MAHKLKLDFLGKDSVPYHNEIEIPDEVYNVLKELKDSKSPEDQLFDATAGTVTGFLKECMPELTPKLFRTALGTKVLCEELRNTKWDDSWSDARKLQAFNDANLAVAKKLNHQHDVAKNFKEQTEKLDAKIEKAKETMKERKKKFAEQILKFKQDREKAREKYKGKELKEALAKIDEKEAKAKATLQRQALRVEAAEINKTMKDATKNYSLGTSKGAYSSPKITVSFCKKMGIDLSKIYSKSLQDKFSWAMDVDEDYWLNYPNVK